MCDAVDRSLTLLESPADRVEGVALAQRIWDETELDAEVSNGMRAECAVQVINMLRTAGVSYNGNDFEDP